MYSVPSNINLLSLVHCLSVGTALTHHVWIVMLIQSIGSLRHSTLVRCNREKPINRKISHITLDSSMMRPPHDQLSELGSCPCSTLPKPQLTTIDVDRVSCSLTINDNNAFSPGCTRPSYIYLYDVSSRCLAWQRSGFAPISISIRMTRVIVRGHKARQIYFSVGPRGPGLVTPNASLGPEHPDNSHHDLP
ncbi:hypothetical protein DM02DRAFT_360002 [Periconia macrospinosa]|uniref:Uncharacterized protein n=1 Tax=Periconia macrospinosa TaxID=97972 RepID=A0A2V1DT52_9PLEO|nr:hypothetical protein DM02DRAFT_360002 [Periconia macrospinosa]